MLYEQYALKIKKYADIRDAILKFKILILSILSVILVATAGFLTVNGMITEGVSGNAEYVFGDTPKFSAKALFSSVSFEYSTDGEQWSADVPDMPGEYYARAVSERSFGFKGHSDAYAFTILKKDVTLNIADDKVQWRMLPSVEAQGLLSSHTLDEALAELENGEIGVTEARVLTDTVKIVNADGKDVTAGYNLITSPKSVEVVARILTLKANDVTKVYDAEPISPNGYTVISADVPENHRVEVKFAPIELSSVGMAKVTISEVKVFEGENNVTPAYYITANEGKAEITQREVTVTSEETVKTYDGEALAFPEIKTEGLVSGHVITVDAYEGAIITPADSRATYVNGVSSIKNADGDDVIGNYKITVRSGALRVNRRGLTVSLNSDSFDADGKRQYDGTPVTLTPVYSGEVEGHTVEFEIIYGGDYITPQSIAVKDFAKVVKITDTQGNDVTDCYEISNSTDTLEITKRALTVTVQSASKMYDGTPLDVKVTADGAIDGHEIIYDVNYGDIINYTEKPITDYISNETVNVVNGELNYTDFYDVTVVNGELGIEKRKIILVTESVTKVYDGKPISHGEVSVRLWEGYGQPEDTPAIIGNDSLYYTFLNYNTYVNAGVYDNLFDESYVVDEYGRYSENYAIDAYNSIFGKLTVEKRRIEVTLKPIVHEYDGQQVLLGENFPDIEYPDGEMPEGEYFDIWIKDVFINPQLPTPYDVGFAIWGADSANYDVRVDYSHATVEIKSVKIIIDANDISVDYRGYNYFAEDLVYTGQEELENVIRANYNLPEGYWLTIGFGNTDGYYLNAGVYNYTLKITVYDNNYRDVTENYEIIINYTNDSYSVLTVNKLKLTFTANDFTKTYDANPVWYWECVDQEGDIAIYDRMSVNLSGEFINAGTYKYSVVCSILSASGNDALENYDITVIYTDPEAEISLITIEKVKITFTANDYTNVYGAYEVDKWMVLDIEGNVVGADNIIFELVDWETNLPIFPKNAGRYEYALAITITNANGEDGSQNYDVTVLYTNAEKQYSVIEITKVPVIIEVVDTSTEYGGYEQTPSWWWYEGKDPWQFVPNNSYEVICTEKHVNVGEYDAKVIFKAYDREGQLVTDNYDVTIIYNGDENAESCKLTITPRKIFVISADDSKEYDGTPLSNTNTTVFHAFDTLLKVQTDEFDQRYFYDYLGDGYKIYVDKDGLYYGDYDSIYCVVGDTVYRLYLYDYGLVNNHYIKVNSYSSITEYGSTPNVLEFVLMSQTEDDIARNYEIVYTQYGTLEIFKRNITVTTQSTYKAYDGKELSDPTARGDRLVNGHSISAVDGTWTVIGPDVQRADNVMEVVILDADGKDVSYNYEISYNYGSLAINKRSILANTQGASKEYDGTPLTNPDYTLHVDYVTSSQGLLEGHTCESFLFTTGSQTEVGQCRNELDGYIVVYDENGNDISNNYEYSTSQIGTLIVTPKKITGTVYNVSVTYDGNAHYSERGKITGGSLNEGDKLLYVRGTELTNAGKSDSIPEIVVIKTKYGYQVLEYSSKTGSYYSNNYVRTTEGKDMYIGFEQREGYLKITADDKVSVYTGTVTGANCKQMNTIYEDGNSIETCVYSFSAGEKKTVEVKKRKIVISCNSATASSADVSSLTAGYRIADGELVDGHYLSAVTTGIATVPGQTEINTMREEDIRIYADKDLTVDITDQVKANYDFSEIINGTLTLT